ncbi:hypothetical protein MMC07_004824 [Pseudocyphellaria aurata]|nr:hypothetical protein [Pseudocyphellaria aurata]
MADGVYVDVQPNIGLDPERIRILSEEGRARIAAENAAKEVKREEKRQKRLEHKGWKGKIQQGLEMIRGERTNTEKEKESGIIG